MLCCESEGGSFALPLSSEFARGALLAEQGTLPVDGAVRLPVELLELAISGVAGVSPEVVAQGLVHGAEWPLLKNGPYIGQLLFEHAPDGLERFDIHLRPIVVQHLKEEGHQVLVVADRHGRPPLSGLL